MTTPTSSSSSSSVSSSLPSRSNSSCSIHTSRSPSVDLSRSVSPSRVFTPIRSSSAVSDYRTPLTSPVPLVRLVAERVSSVPQAYLRHVGPSGVSSTTQLQAAQQEKINQYYRDLKAVFTQTGTHFTLNFTREEVSWIDETGAKQTRSISSIDLNRLGLSAEDHKTFTETLQQTEEYLQKEILTNAADVLRPYAFGEYGGLHRLDFQLLDRGEGFDATRLIKGSPTALLDHPGFIESLTRRGVSSERAQWVVGKLVLLEDLFLHVERRIEAKVTELTDRLAQPRTAEEETAYQQEIQQIQGQYATLRNLDLFALYETLIHFSSEEAPSEQTIQRHVAQLERSVKQRFEWTLTEEKEAKTKRPWAVINAFKGIPEIPANIEYPARVASLIFSGCKEGQSKGAYLQYCRKYNVAPAGVSVEGLFLHAALHPEDQNSLFIEFGNQIEAGFGEELQAHVRESSEIVTGESHPLPDQLPVETKEGYEERVLPLIAPLIERCRQRMRPAPAVAP